MLTRDVYDELSAPDRRLRTLNVDARAERAKRGHELREARGDGARAADAARPRRRERQHGRSHRDVRIAGGVDVGRRERPRSTADRKAVGAGTALDAECPQDGGRRVERRRLFGDAINVVPRGRRRRSRTPRATRRPRGNQGLAAHGRGARLGAPRDAIGERLAQHLAVRLDVQSGAEVARNIEEPGARPGRSRPVAR